ncbi:hypothetical protein [Amycolatopsis vastitatis]|uniref:TFIIB-type domain-containing protein n=1 Tax=Amycolatopsis vastitatis TaxID=1905142 RepID=A0A229SR29_9PSEU|nr:hypothetical protein [Amycolatopsis vastitatis]OXM61535.1 hypothetical protein CF165_38280 [Amycolatopsis vastitatis]
MRALRLALTLARFQAVLGFDNPPSRLPGDRPGAEDDDPELVCPNCRRKKHTVRREAPGRYVCDRCGQRVETDGR